MRYKIRLFTICLHFKKNCFRKKIHVFAEDSLEMQSMSRGNCRSRRILLQCIRTALSRCFRFRPSRNQNPHGQYAPDHLLYSPAYILRLRQSDRLLLWRREYFARPPSTGKFPSPDNVQAPFPKIGRTASFLIVIYASCPILLSFSSDLENT